jgi:hypothetical protein
MRIAATTRCTTARTILDVVEVPRSEQRHQLLTPKRLPNGYRVYSEDDVETVARIRFLLRPGLAAAAIATCQSPLGRTNRITR